MFAAVTEDKHLDALTRIYTKDYFIEHAGSMFRENPETDFCIVEFEVNRLSMINDMYGLGEGDRVLKTIAKVLLEIFNEVELSLVCRVQSDTFAFACPYDKENLETYINGIEDNLKQLSSNLSVDLLMSFGVYVVCDKRLSILSMIERANLALRSVKGNYIQHVGYFTESMRDKAVEETEITAKMNAALINNEFKIFFQPKHSLDDERVVGAEALVRWITPEKGVVSPEKFIPLFEENGFIMKLDAYVWEETCRFIKENQEKGIEVPPISVNVSQVDLYNPHLVDTLVGLTRKYAIDPKMLKLEFTESAYTESTQQMLGIMDKFHEHGMEIDMDDFGSGYSALNVLKDVPVDGLKIDLKFLSKTNEDNSGKAKRILAAVIHMAKWLGIPAIVEGVETIDQVDHLKSLGCTMVQGFYYARPMPESEFVKYIKTKSTRVKLETERPFDEVVINPDEWWENVGSDCEPILEMNTCHILFDRGVGDELGVIRASDSLYEIIGGRERFFNKPFTFDTIVDEDDRKRFFEMFDEINDYHSIGKSICRLELDGQVIWADFKIRLLEKNEDHRVFFAVVDDVTRSVASVLNMSI
ncbi:MAG: GGDEF domain-containing phosphodiesterase [Lachnospiraceae bacterium]|nr:GGDEF domain-containing phosphodiesterase [Lachnospiraceae bacterium]